MENALIEQARKIHYTRWYEIEYLIEQAEDEETKEHLKWIMTEKRLLEEIKC